MPDDPAQLHQKAEACRQLTDTAEDAYRKVLWQHRAEYWEKLAAIAVTLANQRRSHSRTET